MTARIVVVDKDRHGGLVVKGSCPDQHSESATQTDTHVISVKNLEAGGGRFKTHSRCQPRRVAPSDMSESVVIETSLGDVQFELYWDHAPKVSAFIVSCRLAQ